MALAPFFGAENSPTSDEHQYLVNKFSNIFVQYGMALLIFVLHSTSFYFQFDVIITFQHFILWIHSFGSLDYWLH